jgi:hypothetical protein
MTGLAQPDKGRYETSSSLREMLNKCPPGIFQLAKRKCDFRFAPFFNCLGS